MRNDEARAVLERNRGHGPERPMRIMGFVWVFYGLLFVVLSLLSFQPIVGASERLFRAGGYVQAVGTIEASGYEIPFQERGRSKAYPHTTYVYEVRGLTYRSGRIKHMEGAVSPEWAGWFAQEFAPGRSVQVHHDPRWPSRSVLLMDVSAGEAAAKLGFYGTLWLFFILAATVTVVMTRSERRVVAASAR